MIYAADPRSKLKDSMICAADPRSKLKDSMICAADPHEYRYFCLSDPTDLDKLGHAYYFTTQPQILNVLNIKPNAPTERFRQSGLK